MEGTLTERKTRPVVVWAWVGAGVLALMTYTIARWIITGEAKPTPTGVTPVPDWMRTIAVVLQVVFVAGSIVVGYFMVVREWRREGHLTFNGMNYICVQTAWWQDTFQNYIRPLIGYNSVLVNFGSWNASLPGWVSPHGELMPSPVVFYFGMYPLLFSLGTLGIMRLMRIAQTRRGLGNVRLIMETFAMLAVFSFTVEIFFVRTGLYHFGGFGGPRVFGDHWYTVPIFAPVLDAAMWTAWSAILYFRNDRGETIAERGVEELRLSRRAKTGIRLLALYGVLHVAYLVTYTAPVQLFALHANEWPREVQERSYFTNGICGEGPDTACPGPRTPIPLDTRSLRIDPDGKLLIPYGTIPPEVVPLKRD